MIKITAAEQEILNSILMVAESTLSGCDNFGAIADSDDIPAEITTFEENLYDIFQDKVITARGITKFVIIHENLPFVIKIPFNGYWYQEENEKPTFFEYECAPESGWDYCETECCIYDSTVSNQMNQIFAECSRCEYLVHGFYAYIQEKIQYTENEIKYEHPIDFKRAGADSKKILKDEFGFARISSSDEWDAKVIEYYGEDFYEKLINFIEDEGLTDFHNGNVGYREDGSPVIIDYSGYND